MCYMKLVILYKLSTMKKLIILLVLCAATTGMDGCKKSDDPTQINVRTSNISVNWFRDASTPNPTAFIDFYNGVAYTESNATVHAGSTDAFVVDHGIGPVIFQEIDFRNMTLFGTGDFYSKDTFTAVVGMQAFSTYTASTFYQVSMSSVEFNNIRYNSDIASLWATKGLNGGYANMVITAADLTNTLKYYQFVCANGRRGFFHVASSNYLPGSTMVMEVKVEQ